MWRKTYMYRCNRTGSSIPLWLMQTNFNLLARKYRENLQYLYVSIISRHESFNVAGLPKTVIANQSIKLRNIVANKSWYTVANNEMSSVGVHLKKISEYFFSLTFRNFFKIHLTILKRVFKHTLVQFFVQSHYSKAIQSIIL